MSRIPYLEVSGQTSLSALGEILDAYPSVRLVAFSMRKGKASNVDFCVHIPEGTQTSLISKLVKTKIKVIRPRAMDSTCDINIMQILHAMDLQFREIVYLRLAARTNDVATEDTYSPEEDVKDDK